ncbi:MAG: hypothetical protein HQL65_10085 [Magnetococcales bacterium]|nr:hypothetical protein [Magnetococcales bacterium]
MCRVQDSPSKITKPFRLYPAKPGEGRLIENRNQMRCCYRYLTSGTNGVHEGDEGWVYIAGTKILPKLTIDHPKNLFDRNKNYCPDIKNEKNEEKQKYYCLDQDFLLSRAFKFHADSGQDVFPEDLIHPSFYKTFTEFGYIADSKSIRFQLVGQLPSGNLTGGKLVPVTHCCRNHLFADGDCLERPCLTNSTWKSAWKFDSVKVNTSPDWLPIVVQLSIEIEEVVQVAQKFVEQCKKRDNTISENLHAFVEEAINPIIPAAEKN